MHRVEKSYDLYRRANQLIPGGTQLLSRRPTKYANGVSPVYAARAKGARIWDVDGNEYIDWVSGIGAIILGYCDPVVDDAVREQIGKGVAIVPTAPERARNRDAHYPYRYDSYFYHLSGFTEPEAVVVIVAGANSRNGARNLLFCREKNEEREIWDGFRFGPPVGGIGRSWLPSTIDSFGTP